MSGVGCWHHCHKNGPFPGNLIQAGVDCDGELIYVGRAFYKGDVLPAKVIPTKNAAYVCYDRQEILMEEFEVLCNGEYEWQFASDGSVPESAIRIGQTGYGEPLYMGRAICRGSLTLGKVHPSHRCCYLPYDGKELNVATYEVLCILSS